MFGRFLVSKIVVAGLLFFSPLFSYAYGVETHYKLTENAVHESLVSQYSKTGYTGGGHVAEAQIMVDSTLQKDLDECAGKIRMHQAKIEDYSAYVELLSKRPQNDRFDLHMDDWQHFFGK
jgi:hypothetical protein